jgi:hypothetical protein
MPRFDRAKPYGSAASNSILVLGMIPTTCEEPNTYPFAAQYGASIKAELKNGAVFFLARLPTGILEHFKKDLASDTQLNISSRPLRREVES